MFDAETLTQQFGSVHMEKHEFENGGWSVFKKFDILELSKCQCKKQYHGFFNLNTSTISNLSFKNLWREIIFVVFEKHKFENRIKSNSKILQTLRDTEGSVAKKKPVIRFFPVIKIKIILWWVKPSQ